MSHTIQITTTKIITANKFWQSPRWYIVLTAKKHLDHLQLKTAQFCDVLTTEEG